MRSRVIIVLSGSFILSYCKIRVIESRELLEIVVIKNLEKGERNFFKIKCRLKLSRDQICLDKRFYNLKLEKQLNFLIQFSYIKGLDARLYYEILS